VYLALKSGSISMVTNLTANDWQCSGAATSERHAWRYTNGVGMKDLGPSKSVGSGGDGINNLGNVVGNVGGTNPYPFIYIDGYGMLDVRKLSGDIPDAATGISLRSINDDRDIAGSINGIACFLRASTP
jgi:probable HAF family extracellular repeat protein